MANWQRAGEIPGLAPGASGPPAMPRAGGASAERRRPRRRAAVDRLSAVGILSARALLYVIGFLLVIPAPWAGRWFYRWVVSRLHVPGRPNLAFTGQVGDTLVGVRR